MPTNYAHKVFGASVYRGLPKEYRELIREHLELFVIGLHGPDLLFFHRLGAKSSEVAQFGHWLHRQPLAEFYENAKLQIKAGEEDEKLVYFLGCLCHFFLDTVCHPYVNKAKNELGVTHGKLEMEFDRYLMERDGKSPMTYPVAAHLGISPELSRHIAPFYLGVSPAQITECLVVMKGAYRMAKINGKAYRRLLCNTLAHFGDEEKVASLVMSRQKSRICAQAVRTLEELSKDAEFLAREAIIEFCRTLYAEEALPDYTALAFV